LYYFANFDILSFARLKKNAANGFCPFFEKALRIPSSAKKKAGEDRMEKRIDLTQGVIWKGLMTYFFPILLGAFFQQLYNTVDAVVVGNFVGKEALAAVGGSASQIINLMVEFFIGLSSGATVVIAQYFGAKNASGLHTALQTTVAFALITGAGITVVGIVISGPMMLLMDTPDDIMTFSTQYVRIIFAGILPSMLYNMGGGILRALGDSRRPLYYLIVCCVTNILLDLLFVAVFKWEVIGAALATILSQAVSAVLVMRALSRLDDSYRFRYQEVAVNRPELAHILRIGLPSGVQASMYSISNLLIQTSVNSLGTDTVAAWTACSKADSLFWMIMNAFGVTILTFVGQNIGAGNKERAHQGVKTCFKITMTTALVLSTLLFFEGKILLTVFSSDLEVLEIGFRAMRHLVPFYFTWVFVEVLSSALRGSGNAFAPMVITILGICVLRVIWVYAAIPLNPCIEMICYSYGLTWSVTGAAFLVYYYKVGRSRFFT